MLALPRVVQRPSPNYSPTPIRHDLFVFHMMQGGYLGSVSYLCLARVQASAHLCMSEDGTEVSQLVPLGMKAWAECAFNGLGGSLEIPGFTEQGIPDARWAAAALIAAWYCHAYALPPVWAPGGRGRGLCQHHDLGAEGGGHVDCSDVGGATWLKVVQMTQSAHADLARLPSLPDFALYGAPNPAQAQLPPAVTPTPSHGGALRIHPDEAPAPHPTASGFPLASIGDWQWRLRQVGANPELAVDDDEGSSTRTAIGVFQAANRLPVTREVNPATWAKLYAATTLAAAA